MKEITPQELAELIRRHPRVVALTGAGISVESGIPDFRSPGGLWSRFDPMEYAHIQALRRNPAKVWQLLKEMDETISRARPNPAHYALAELEARGFLAGIITQNVDNLHQAAGSKRVVEYHGNALNFVCDTCKGRHPRETLDFSHTPLYCLCGGLIRPDVVFSGSRFPRRPRPRPRNWPSTATCSWSSAPPGEVAPASYLPHHRQRMARRHRRKQPGTHPPHLYPHPSLPQRPRRVSAGLGNQRIRQLKDRGLASVLKTLRVVGGGGKGLFRKWPFPLPQSLIKKKGRPSGSPLLLYGLGGGLGGRAGTACENPWPPSPPATPWRKLGGQDFLPACTLLIP